MASGSERGVPVERLLHMYRTMVRVRTFDERLSELGRGREPIIHHPTLGQEAPAVAACATLRPDDVILPYHRGWAWAIGKGMAPGRILAELLGRRTGYCRGQSGPNLADWDTGVLGRSGIQGAHLQIAAGVGLALRSEGLGRVCLAFFGEGASNTGAFHEGLTLAALWRAPVVYVCESNGYQSNTPAAEVLPVETVAQRAHAYGIPGVRVDGNDAVEVHLAAAEAVERARRGDGPSLLDCRTYRWGIVNYLPHAMDRDGRPPEEREEWRRRCPIARLGALLSDAGLLSPEESSAIQAEAEREVEEAVAFAYASPFPTREELMADVYAS